MTILSYLKIGVVAAVVLVVSYLAWSNHRMASVIESQKQEIAGLKLAVEVVQKAQEATKKYLNSMSQVQRREAREQAEIESAVQGGDDKSMRAIFERHGLLAPKSNPAPSR